ncbi:MAG TPA: (d)CMP kinase [Actinomycetaceae bacterium]|nr:(d)CMP kinase [Actinomycetaceae bacterium]
MTGFVIAIDGPSGSGKSTVSRLVASDCGLAYLDTGAMYRAATWWCRHQGIDLRDEPRVREAVAGMPLDMVTDPDEPRVVCGGHDITDAIRESTLSQVVSQVATNLGVRAELQRRQREEIAAERTGGRSQGRGIIAEGRDITTVVAPDAQVRILLIASEEARLARRARELHGRVDDNVLAATRDEVVRRDADDATVSTFFTAADGVATIDSSRLDLAETVAAVRHVIAEAKGRT